ncbi:MAG: hypothetical protein U0166_23840 [Acidobacteriota bacterium]
MRGQRSRLARALLCALSSDASEVRRALAETARMRRSWRLATRLDLSAAMDVDEIALRLGTPRARG